MQRCKPDIPFASARSSPAHEVFTRIICLAAAHCSGPVKPSKGITSECAPTLCCGCRHAKEEAEKREREERQKRQEELRQKRKVIAHSPQPA